MLQLKVKTFKLMHSISRVLLNCGLLSSVQQSLVSVLTDINVCDPGLQGASMQPAPFLFEGKWVQLAA